MQIARQCLRFALLGPGFIGAMAQSVSAQANSSPPAAQGASAPAVSTASQAAPPSDAARESLRDAMTKISTAIAGLDIQRWKEPADVRQTTQSDVDSIERDLNGTLPNLLAQASPASAGPGQVSTSALAPDFAVFRNVDALYDVLLRVTQTAVLAHSPDADSLEDARAALESARFKLGASLLQSIGEQDAQLARYRSAPPAPVRPAAAPPAPTKIVVDDGPVPAKRRKKKPAPAPAPPGQ